MGRERISGFGRRAGNGRKKKINKQIMIDFCMKYVLDDCETKVLFFQSKIITEMIF